MEPIDISTLSLQQSPIDDAVDSIVARLALCVDINGNPINFSVKRGWDAVFQDAIEMNPPADALPCIRVFKDTENNIIESVQTEVHIVTAHIMLYFVYYHEIGLDLFKSNGDVTDFDQFRTAHIRTNRQWLEEWNADGWIPSIGVDGYKFDNPQIMTVEHTNVLRDLVGVEYSLVPPTYVSRMDLNIRVNEYKDPAKP